MSLLSKYPQLNDEEWVRKQAETKTAREIAKEVKCSETTVMYTVKKYGITLPHPKRRGTHAPYILYPQLQDEAWLREEITKKPMRQIAEEIGCSLGAVTYCVHQKFGLVMPLRTPKGVKGAFCRYPKLHEEEWFREQVATKSLHMIADEAGCSYGGVINAVRKFGIEVPQRSKPRKFRQIADPQEVAQRASELAKLRVGDKASNWKGGRIKIGTKARPYIKLHWPDHHEADYRGYVMEHRVVMEEKLGRPLERTEKVHHMNNDSTDNRPENLEVYKTQKEHFRRHFDAVGREVALDEENKHLKARIAELESQAKFDFGSKGD